MTEEKKQNCGNCRFWLSAGDQPVQDSGYCRRNPPVSSSARYSTAFPGSYKSDWCGEYLPANPETIQEAASVICRLYLMGDKSAAYAALDKIQDARQEETSDE